MNIFKALKALRDFLKAHEKLNEYVEETFGEGVSLKHLLGLKTSQDPGDYPYVSYVDVQGKMKLRESRSETSVFINVGVCNDAEDDDGYVGIRIVHELVEKITDALMERLDLGGTVEAVMPDFEVLTDVRMVHPFYGRGILCEVRIRESIRKR